MPTAPGPSPSPRSAAAPARPRSLLLLAAYMGAVFGLSHMPEPPLPAAATAIPDKVLHAAEYLVLGYLFAQVFPGSTKRRALLGLLAAALYGLSDELHQAFVPGREASLGDWVADVVGSAAGAFLYRHFAERTLRRYRGTEADDPSSTEQEKIGRPG